MIASQFTEKLNRIHPLDKLPWCENFPCPIDLESVNTRLAELGGTDARGYPLFRAVWGQSSEQMEWCMGEMRAKYLFAAIEIPVDYEYFDMETGVTERRHWSKAKINPYKNKKMFSWKLFDIGVGRIFFEKLVDPSEYSDWDKFRYHEEPHPISGEMIAVDAIGPKPDVLYWPLFPIASHARCGCNGSGSVPIARGGFMQCYGLFREPIDADFARVRKILHDRNAQKRLTPSEQREADVKASMEKNIAIYDRIKARRKEQYLNYLMPMHHRFDPGATETGNQHGRYIFTRGSSKSGLLKEEIAQIHAGNAKISLPGEQS